MLETIIAAIEKRRLLQLTYKDHARTIEPHCVGIGHSENTLLRCWQTAGGSNSGKCPDWKLMRVSQIHDGSMCKGGFSGVRDGYNPQDSAMRHIYAAL